jgi:hypothetical protein
MGIDFGVDDFEVAAEGGEYVVSGAGEFVVHESGDVSVFVAAEVSEVVNVEVSSFVSDDAHEIIEVGQSGFPLFVVDVGLTRGLVIADLSFTEVVDQAEGKSEQVVVGKLVDGVGPAISDSDTGKGNGVGGVFSVVLKDTLGNCGDVMSTVGLSEDVKRSLVVTGESGQLVEVDEGLDEIGSNLVFVGDVFAVGSI